MNHNATGGAVSYLHVMFIYVYSKMISLEQMVTVVGKLINFVNIKL